MSRPSATCSLPTTAMLFSDWQATTQALQPMQVSVSITMPHARASQAGPPVSSFGMLGLP